MLKLISAALIERLAAENRRVFAEWRALILLRRATLEIPANARRWSQMPEDVSDIYPALRQMQQRGEIKPVPNVRGVYEVTAPYVGSGLVDEYEMLMEVNPYGTVAYLSAMAYHGLTDDLPKGTTVIVPLEMPEMLPPGTMVEDWEGVPRPIGRRPAHLLDRPVRWVRIRAERYFGMAEYHRQGYPVRITDRERTLLDGLLEPDLCGGLQHVLRALVHARDLLDLDLLTYYTERFGIAVLRQRVGYVLDELGLAHPTVEGWRRQAHRGGSSKLLGSAPYSQGEAAAYSTAWNLALNAPVTVLREGAR